MTNRTITTLALVLAHSWAMAQASLLRSGPMNAWADMKEAAVWVQTTQAATVQLRYWETANPATAQKSDPITTQREHGFTATLLATGVQPGHRYSYEVLVNNKKVKPSYKQEFQTQELWAWRKDPPAFKVAIGSCLYVNEPELDRPGKPYGRDLSILQNITTKKPDLMLWLGDNIYLREADWNSHTGYYHRYTHMRSQPEMAELLSSTQHYAIWDDHDYGPNDGDRGWWHKHIALQSFRDFFPNPSTGVAGGTSASFVWNDVHFILLDDRYFRAPNADPNPDKDYLGQRQLNWLRDVLTFSKAPFKVIAVGGQVLNSVAKYENMATYPGERKKLLELVAETKATGVIFLSGDRHMTELSRMERPGTYPLHDLTCSPLSSGSYDSQEDNIYRVDGTRYADQNYGILEFSGPREDRVLTMRIYRKDGTEVWNKELKAKDLK